jgi:hypothetical protein
VAFTIIKNDPSERDAAAIERDWKIPNPNAPIDRQRLGDVVEDLVKQWPAELDGSPVKFIAVSQIVDAIGKLAPSGLDRSKLGREQVLDVLRERGYPIEAVDIPEAG